MVLLVKAPLVSLEAVSVRKKKKKNEQEKAQTASCDNFLEKS